MRLAAEPVRPIGRLSPRQGPTGTAEGLRVDTAHPRPVKFFFALGEGYHLFVLAPFKETNKENRSSPVWVPGPIRIRRTYFKPESLGRPLLHSPAPKWVLVVSWGYDWVQFGTTM